MFPGFTRVVRRNGAFVSEHPCERAQNQKRRRAGNTFFHIIIVDELFAAENVISDNEIKIQR